jgi:hypothetical protein
MIKIILVFSISIICSFVYSQDNRFIYQESTSESELNQEIKSRILGKSDANISVDFVKIDLDKLFLHEKLVLQFGENNLIINKEKLEQRNTNSIYFFGKNKDNSIILSFLDGDIQGTITTQKGVYQIETIDKDNYAIVKIDHSKLNEKCDDIQDNSLADSLHTIGDNVIDENINNLEDESLNSISSLLLSYDCKVRVLILYTPAAQTSVSNIENTILLAIDETNQSFINSNVNNRVELAYAGSTNYTEVDSYTDKVRFRNTNDGYMDEVHSLRNKYAADVCVLITDYNNAVCGEAYGIYVPASDAFCVVQAYNCATGYYSFGHEIAHLVGCRHDTYVDPTTTPFAYGHGYVYPTGGWRTIMAYANACPSCNRIQYWSNPNVTLNGVAMGTSAINDNARVWNEQANRVMGFRQPENSVTVTSSDVSSSLYADVIAKQSIITSGTVNVNSGKSLNMRAGNSITLQPGFSVELGTEFSATIENIYDCGTGL